MYEEDITKSKIVGVITVVVAFTIAVGLPIVGGLFYEQSQTERVVTATVVEKSVELNGRAQAVVTVPSDTVAVKQFIDGTYLPGDQVQVNVDENNNIVTYPLTAVGITAMITLTVTTIGSAFLYMYTGEAYAYRAERRRMRKRLAHADTGGQ